jgi:AcrR family transcriptional regulator
MSGAGQKIFLRQEPTQQRSIDTVDLILRVAAQLLGDVGIERLSTNLICAKAGLTPPALYRYFPNKYAVLKELGKRMMDRQNEVFLAWLENSPAIFPVASKEASALSLKQLQEAVNAATADFPGGVWVMRALRAVPQLHSVRLESHYAVSGAAYELIRPHYPHVPEADLRLATRLSTEVMYSATEMVFDDPQFDADRINAEVADMVVRYFEKFVESAPPHK